MNEYQKAAEYLDNRFNKHLYKLPRSAEEANSFIRTFQNRFSPFNLKQVRKGDVLRTVLLPNTPGTMINLLISEDADCPSNNLGHVGRQFYNNFPLSIYSKNTNYIKIGRGMPKEENKLVSFAEAEELAFEFVNLLADACLSINADELESIYDYVKMGNFLERKIGGQAKHAWFHKYLYFIYPSLFNNFHTLDYKSKTLLALSVRPEKSFYAMDGQWAEIVKNMSLKDSYVIANVIYSDPKLMEIVNPTKKDKRKEKSEQKSISHFDDSESLDDDSRIISTGNFGCWQIVNRNLILLDFGSDCTDNMFALPNEVITFFSTSKIEINDKFEAILNDNGEGTFISFDDGFLSMIAEYVEERHSGALVIFERRGVKNFSVSLKPGLERVITPISEEQIALNELEEYKTSHENYEVTETVIEQYEYQCKPEKRRNVDVKNKEGVFVYPRDPKKRINALIRANYCCEYNNDHTSFISKTTLKPYMETHHLIPIEYWQSFTNSLDVEANIVCLCSNCHNQIHYGVDAKDIIMSLYDKRKSELYHAGIDISLPQLLEIYSGEYEKNNAQVFSNEMDDEEMEEIYTCENCGGDIVVANKQYPRCCPSCGIEIDEWGE